jgi:hypothetical protein
MARMTERRRWLMLVLTLIAGLGGGLLIAYLWIGDVERESQRDLCELMAVFDDPAAPPATTDRGRAQQSAIRAYRLKRC